METTRILTSRKTVDGTRTTAHVDFGVADARGRAIGVRIETAVVTFAALPADATSGWVRAPGTYYLLCMQATRNGARYGATQPAHYFATDAERTAAMTKMFAASRRRAVAKAGAA